MILKKQTKKVKFALLVAFSRAILAKTRYPERQKGYSEPLRWYRASVLRAEITEELRYAEDCRAKGKIVLAMSALHMI